MQRRTGDHTAQWAKYRRRRRFNRLVLFVGLPFVVAAWVLIEAVVPFRGALLALVGPWMAAAVIGRIRLIRWPCPRCGHPYFATRWYNNEWANNCVHCELELWK